MRSIVLFIAWFGRDTCKNVPSCCKADCLKKTTWFRVKRIGGRIDSFNYKRNRVKLSVMSSGRFGENNVLYCKNKRTIG